MENEQIKENQEYSENVSHDNENANPEIKVSVDESCVNIDMKASYKKKLAKKDEEIERLNKDVEKWKNDYYRAYADMANLRKDIQKDHNEAVKYRIEGFVQDLLQVLDSFEIALKNKPESEETKNYLKGFEYVYSTLLNILSNEGVNIIEPIIDTKFDSKVMQAVDKIECDGEENLVKEVMLKGYKLYDHLIRPSMVKVSTKKVEKNEDINDVNAVDDK